MKRPTELIDSFDAVALGEHFAHQGTPAEYPVQYKVEGCSYCYVAQFQPALHAAWFMTGVWEDRTDGADVLASLQDGYGEVGYGDDWSGVRDSTPATIEVMYNALLELLTEQPKPPVPNVVHVRKRYADGTYCGAEPTDYDISQGQVTKAKRIAAQFTERGFATEVCAECVAHATVIRNLNARKVKS